MCDVLSEMGVMVVDCGHEQQLVNQVDSGYLTLSGTGRLGANSRYLRPARSG